MITRILIFILLFHLNLNAQSKLDEAKAYFFQAETQYESGNSSKALEYLDQAETLIGTTNGSIEALRVKAYYKTEQFEEAQASLTNFYEYADSAPMELQKEMSGYLVKIKEGIKEREAAEERRREQEKKEREERILAQEMINEKERFAPKINLLSQLSLFDYKRNTEVLMDLYQKGYGVKYLLWGIANDAEALSAASYKKDNSASFFFKDKFKVKVDILKNKYGSVNFIKILNLDKQPYVFYNNAFEFITEIEMKEGYIVRDQNIGRIYITKIDYIGWALKIYGNCQLMFDFYHPIDNWNLGKSFGSMGSLYKADCYMQTNDCDGFINNYPNLLSSWKKSQRKKFAKKCGL